MIVLFFLTMAIPGTIYSQNKVRVVVLPFKIFSLQKDSYLSAEIPRVIRMHLQQDGAEVIEPQISPQLWEEASQHIEDIRKLGVKTGADYLIWGSLTRIGKKYSLDAKMLQTFEETPPIVYYVEGNIQNLSGIVRQLVNNFGSKLFKRERVYKVLIEGNQRIEEDAIKRIIKTKPGDIYLAKSLSEDLKTVYAMGYFDDVRIESEDSPRGKTIIFKVKEKPTIRLIRIIGNRVFDDEEIKEQINIKTGSILNIFSVKSNIQLIELLYKDKNYQNVAVDYKIIPLDPQNNQADLEFIIDEGKKIRIKEIRLLGNQAYSDKELKKLMKTSEKGFWSWLTASGELKREDLNQDVAKLTAFYHNNGYVRARIGEPSVEYRGDWIFIEIRIDEGPQYEVGEVDIRGDLVLDKKELLNKLKITTEKYYNREMVRSDIMTLTDVYSDEGYAYADISPRININDAAKVVDIAYTINRGKQVYFEKIIITGNTKTRDKVIRRELQVYEQELYSGRKLKRGVRNLIRLDYFEDVRVDTQQGSSDNQMVLKIDVTEKPTGQFSFGGGYSSIENVFFMASVSQRNLFGRGQLLQLKGEIGGTTNRYTLSFTEPWLFDIPLSAGFDIYNWKRDYDTYDKDSKGGAVRFGYPIWDFTRFYIKYAYDIGEIENISEDASRSIKALEGTNVTSSVTTTLRYDSRDRVFNPTEGSDHSLSVEYAGIGGDIAFTKYIGDTGWYFPLFWGTVGFLHARAGFVEKNPGGLLPDYERFYLGGINSLRGFDWRDISPVDEDGAKIGGNKFVQFNVEYLIPLVTQAGLMGVIFFDTGDVYDNDEDIDFGNLRESAGGGIRWYSPIGPIRIEYGYILDPIEGEAGGGRWEFTMGSAF